MEYRLRGEKGHPQQFLVRATSKSLSFQYYFLSVVSNPPIFTLIKSDIILMGLKMM